VRTASSVPADERRRLSREVRHAAFDRPRGRELGDEPLPAELVQALRPSEVLQPVVAEVAEGEAVEVLGKEVARRLREQDLPAVARRSHAGSPVHVEADVAVGSRRGLTGVEPHPNADDFLVRPRMRRERALRLRRGSRRGAGGGERDEERVTLGAEFGSVMRRERRAQETVVLGEEVGPVLVEPLGEDRRALDVREQEGDGAAWRLHVRRA
jgi:hypothetical protein